MNTMKDDVSSSCCKSKTCFITGVVFLGLATLLTLVTLNGMGIFGLFVVGVILIYHRNMNSKSCMCCSGCDCKCCSSSSVECNSMSEDIKPKTEKKTTAKKA